MDERKVIPSMNPDAYRAKCQAINPSTKDVCGAIATHIVTFQDQSKARVCADCALYLGQIAGTHGETIKTERLT
jgi:hypothetical protein